MGPLIVLIGASTVLVWLAFIIVCICVISALENDSPGWATTSIAITLAALWFFTDFSYRYNLRGHFEWQTALALVIVYIACGISWSFFKWYMELSERREKWDEVVKKYRNLYKVPDNVPVKSRIDKRFEDYVKENHLEFVNKESYRSSEWYVQARPKPNKSRIIAWMVYWPWSLLWSLFDDLITGIFRWFYRQLVGTYESMAKWMFSDIDIDG